MTKHPSAAHPHPRTPPQRRPLCRQPPHPDTHPRKARPVNSQTPSQSTAHRTTSPTDSYARLTPVYKSPQQSRQFALILIQDLVQIFSYDANIYCFMLKMLSNLTFDGLSDVSLKVAITVFHLGSKYFNSKGPRLSDLLLWAGSRITKDEVIKCEEAICKGFDFDFPHSEDLPYDQVKVLCTEYEYEIFTQPN